MADVNDPTANPPAPVSEPEPEHPASPVPGLPELPAEESNAPVEEPPASEQDPGQRD